MFDLDSTTHHAIGLEPEISVTEFSMKLREQEAVLAYRTRQAVQSALQKAFRQDFGIQEFSEPTYDNPFGSSLQAA